MCVAQMSTRPVGDDRQGKRIGPTDETDETDAWAGRIHRACAAIGRHRTGATRGTEPEASIRTEHAKARAFEDRGHSRRLPPAIHEAVAQTGVPVNKSVSAFRDRIGSAVSAKLRPCATIAAYRGVLARRRDAKSPPCSVQRPAACAV